MSMTWNGKERNLDLSKLQIEGLETGMLDDLKYRPNKYFHPIEEVKLEGEKCKIIYQKELFGLEGKIGLDQVIQALRGVLDGQHKLASHQVYYLYPGVQAFGLDRRRNLRVGLINARPLKDTERKSEELCVDAFVHLLASHCPEGHKKIKNYKQNILTLRHLLQILEGRHKRALFVPFVLLLFIVGTIAAALYQWGPPRLQQAMRQGLKDAVIWGRNIVRSGTDQWEVSLREERRKWDYRHTPLSVSLIIAPQTTDPEQRKILHRNLLQILGEEFEQDPKAKYLLFIPDPTKFPVIYQQNIALPTRYPDMMNRWQQKCAVMFPQGCPEDSWLLYVENYRGGSRPLVDAIREAIRPKQQQGHLQIKYQQLIGSVSLDWNQTAKPAKGENKSQDVEKPQTDGKKQSPHKPSEHPKSKPDASK